MVVVVVAVVEHLELRGSRCWLAMKADVDRNSRLNQAFIKTRRVMRKGLSNAFNMGCMQLCHHT